MNKKQNDKCHVIYFQDEIQIQIPVRFFSRCDINLFVDLIQIKVINIRKKTLENNCLIPAKLYSVISWGRATLYGALSHLSLNKVTFTICLSLNIHMNKYYQIKQKNKHSAVSLWVLSQMTDVPDNRRPRWPKIRAINTTGYIQLSRFYLSLLEFRTRQI